MNQRISAMIGTALILLGGLFLLLNLAFDTAGVWVWRTWPLFIVAGGVLFMLVPIFFRSQSWTGFFYIPGTSILAIGLLLLVSSTGDSWRIWEWAWSLVILAAAAGLILAALATRIYWVGVPAILIGATGLILAYCAVTGNWSAWVWLWGLEVAAVGFMILAVGYLAKNIIVRTVGWSIVGFGAFAATVMMAMAGQNSRPMTFVSAAILILGGIALVAGGMLTGKKPATQSETTAATPQ
jgi:hypothetical protein